MDEETIVVLAIQLFALLCIAAALVVYLICKVNRRKHTYDSEFPTLNVGTGRSILITSCETVFGIQLALHLTSLGFRVFAGVKPDDANENAINDNENKSSDSVRILRAKLKQREALSTALIGIDGEEYIIPTSNFGSLITVPLDVTREDMLHEAMDHVRRHLPAGEDGLWAIINTAGVCFKGKLEQQDSSQWETMFKVNVFGMLRTARTFMPLLKNKKGRLITIGTGNEYKFGSTGAVVYNAARYAVAGASCSLNQEMSVHGVSVITIHTESIPSEKLFLLPKIPRSADDGQCTTVSDRYLKFNTTAVPNYALNVIEEALLGTSPKEDYYITKPTGFTNYLSAITEKLENIQKKKYNIERTI